MELVYRLSPGRTLPSRSGEGLPVVKTTSPRSRSIAGACQTPPPPRSHAFACLALSAFSRAMFRFSRTPKGSVSLHCPHHPPSSGLEMISNLHTCAHVLAPNPRMNPQIHYSPPLPPARTLP